MRRIRLALPVLLLALLPVAGCGEDDATPLVDATVRVETARFFPATVTIPAGGRVRWVNLMRREAATDRTVTSGTGPDDPSAGILFDVTLRGFEPGQPEGDDFVFRFEDQATYIYFSRLPDGSEFTGTVVVQ